MSRSRYTRWSDSALLFVVKSRNEGKSTKWIAHQVNRGEPAVIEALRKIDADRMESLPSIPPFRRCPDCGAVGLLCLASGPIMCAICKRPVDVPTNGPDPA